MCKYVHMSKKCYQACEGLLLNANMLMFDLSVLQVFGQTRTTKELEKVNLSPDDGVRWKHQIVKVLFLINEDNMNVSKLNGNPSAEIFQWQWTSSGQSRVTPSMAKKTTTPQYHQTNINSYINIELTNKNPDVYTQMCFQARSTVL